MPTLTILIPGQPDIRGDATSITLPAVPILASCYLLDFDSKSVQLWYGSPDRAHAEVKVITGDGVTRESFTDFDAAGRRFLELAAL